MQEDSRTIADSDVDSTAKTMNTCSMVEFDCVCGKERRFRLCSSHDFKLSFYSLAALLHIKGSLRRMAASTATGKPLGLPARELIREVRGMEGLPAYNVSGGATSEFASRTLATPI